MEIIIGREEQSRRLKMASGEKYKVYGSPQSVPTSVSRNNHCCLYIDEEGRMTISNLRPSNQTYVNGVSVEMKRVTCKDRIELGVEQYALNWNWVNEFVKQIQPPAPVDIRPLKKVYDDYHEKTLSLTKSQARINVIRGGVGVLTLGSSLPMMMGGERLVWPFAIAIVIMIATFIKGWIDSSKVTHQRDEMNHQFMKDYTCPNCRHFFGNYPYDIVANNNSKCPGCGRQLKK